MWAPPSGPWRDARPAPYLCHGQSTSFGEGVVIEVEHAEVGVVLHGRGQRSDTRVVDAVLGHVHLLQAAHQLQGGEGEKITVENRTGP